MCSSATFSTRSYHLPCTFLDLPAGYQSEDVKELMRMYQTIHSDHEVRRFHTCVLECGAVWGDMPEHCDT